jgi:threonine/homoserine/homoserine lactone efflux protein
VLVWGCLSAVALSSLILASEIVYGALRVGGAVVLVVLGVRSILHGAVDLADIPRGRPGWRSGLVTSVANPKLAVFFIALFAQFLSPHAAVLPAALAMAAAIVAYTCCGSRRWPTPSIAPRRCCARGCAAQSSG